METEPTERDLPILVLLAQSGDREAIDELLRSVQQPLWRFILRFIANEHLAEDILQDVFWIIYKKIRWLSDPAVFIAWAYRIASRECFRRIKKEARWRDQVRDDDVIARLPASPEPVFDSDLIDRLPDLLGNVSPASRAVLILHYLDDLSLNETAEILDISPGTAKSRLAYGLASLRKQLSEIKRI
jgi:RNA polymerase sigma-70 factor (ECF subfamily)